MSSRLTSGPGSSTGTTNLRPFTWVQTAAEILDSLAWYLQKIYRAPMKEPRNL